MGRKKPPTLDRLRRMLIGKYWTDFHVRQNTGWKRGRKQRRWLCVDGVFFGAYVDKGEGPPSLKIKAKGQIVVFRFISVKDYDYLKANIYDELRWSHLKDLGPVVAKSGSP